jgi:thiamine kinase
VQQKLDHTLAQWRQWKLDSPINAAPKVEGILGQGHSNFSFLVSAGDLYVARIDGIVPASHGLNRQTELHILKQASSAGLAPCPRYFNPELGALVCDYLPPDEQQQRPAEEIGQLLQKIHSLEARHHRLDLQERIARYENRAHKSAGNIIKSLGNCGRLVSELLHSANAADTTLTLCHNDLLQANRLAHDNQLWALDWEYSAMGSPWYDIAVVIEGDELNDDAAAGVLWGYLERDVTPDEQTLIERYRTIYRYLEILWYATAEQAGPGDSEQAKKIELLHNRLNLNP